MTERIKEQEQLQRELSAAAMGQGDDETKETDNGSSNKSKLLSKKAMAGVVVETSAGDDFDFGKEFVGEKVNGSGNKKRKQSDVMFDDHGDNSEDFEHDNLEDGDKNATPRPDHEFHDDEKLALEYYNSMTEAKKRNKADRQAQGAEINEISLEDIMALEGGEEGDADAAASSKRAISYQIMKNKGLTPHRKKENRNPRVKRRNRYESAMKKLKTFKRVAVDRSKMGGYGGEMTGIKTSLARSVKL